MMNAFAGQMSTATGATHRIVRFAALAHAVPLPCASPSEQHAAYGDLDTGHREKVVPSRTGQWKHDPTEHDFVLLWQAGK
ncbi:MAG: hypothetical protein HZA88_09805 [Verrucomicrobia bacterium]|nr:hypothetical protein [Verrucomicrobiota bacterium]